MANPTPPGSAHAGPAFGISRQPTTRIELVFTLKSGNSILIHQDLREPVTAERLDSLASELADQISKDPGPRTFADDWSASGQRAWVNLAEVAAFSLRPLR